MSSKLVDFLGYTKCNYSETMHLADTYPKVTFEVTDIQ